LRRALLLARRPEPPGASAAVGRPSPVVTALERAITTAFASAAGAAYLGEAVTVAEHMLRTAWRARLAGADAPLVAAALLHDIGHVVTPDSAVEPDRAAGPDRATGPDRAAEERAGRDGTELDAASAFAAGIDAGHEVVGAHWLEPFFPPEVTEPIRLHVLAKRYLCAVDAGYQRALSSASRRTLALQGGPLGPADAAEFTAGPHAAAAVELRRWDDDGKDPQVAVPPLVSYLPLLGRVAR
jgi:gamma-butyrobetaine dioxygenase